MTNRRLLIALAIVAVAGFAAAVVLAPGNGQLGRFGIKPGSPAPPK
jgi:hypothetical protein